MNFEVFFNRTFKKKYLKSMIQWTFHRYGSKKTIELSERLKSLSFRLGTQIGISLSIENFLISREKCLITRISKKKIKKRYIQKQNAIITRLETNQTLIRVWRSISRNFRSILVEIFDKEDLLNPLYLIAFSGARGNLIQARQLIGIRSLMVNPIGRVIESPIQNSFKEDLTLTEFVLQLIKFFVLMFNSFIKRDRKNISRNKRIYILNSSS